MSTTRIKLAELQANPRYSDTQTRAGFDTDALHDYKERMQLGDAFPPPVIFRAADGAFWVGSGFHRIEVLQSMGKDEADVELREGEFIDAFEYNLASNRAHGIRLTHADKEQGIRKAIQNFPDASDRDLAVKCGCDHKTIAKYRKLAPSTGEFPSCPEATKPPVVKRKGRDGKVRKLPKRQEPAAPPSLKRFADAAVGGGIVTADEERAAVQVTPPPMPGHNEDILNSWWAVIEEQMEEAQDRTLLWELYSLYQHAMEEIRELVNRKPTTKEPA